MIEQQGGREKNATVLKEFISELGKSLKNEWLH